MFQQRMQSRPRLLMVLFYGLSLALADTFHESRGFTWLWHVLQVKQSRSLRFSGDYLLPTCPPASQLGVSDSSSSWGSVTASSVSQKSQLGEKGKGEKGVAMGECKKGGHTSSAGNWELDEGKRKSCFAVCSCSHACVVLVSCSCHASLAVSSFLIRFLFSFFGCSSNGMF